jgi:hypothetical protein
MLFLVFILLMSNIVLAFILFSSKDREQRGRSSGDTAMAVYKEIGLSDTQIDSFKTMKDSFFKDMKPLWAEIRTLKDSLYRNMDKGLEDSTHKKLIAEIAAKSQVADQTMYSHFVEIRLLCTDEQKIRFDTIVPKLVNRSWRRR